MGGKRMNQIKSTTKTGIKQEGEGAQMKKGKKEDWKKRRGRGQGAEVGKKKKVAGLRKEKGKKEKKGRGRGRENENGMMDQQNDVGSVAAPAAKALDWILGGVGERRSKRKRRKGKQQSQSAPLFSWLWLSCLDVGGVDGMTLGWVCEGRRQVQKSSRVSVSQSESESERE
ncbi:hypothetical protein ASPBRDRAFT_411326 [Aspergillus brasiliensis CBS 101740]|uniref:Uncharacterized protein n=1 Tax=Aspergillus brasiliensis (strain CBS 101740 / IMI 381727 / IBT 21946) TaxID=767769 RepID=A0A1L9UXW0_ASPBC|nr:hypothetical protein ASPBRDRAFT_411326 [Aspergillus brasiliensis CBS 101740]